MRARSQRRLAPMAALLWLWPAAAGAQQPPAGVVTALQGQATVARAALPSPLALRSKDDLFVRGRIETRQHSLVRVLLGGKALVTVRELSSLTITEEPGRALVDLQEGKVALGVAKRLLKPGESIQIRTPNAVAAVRGSEIAEVVVTGGIPQTTITALEISIPVTVASLVDPTAVVTLGINQAVRVLGVRAAATLTPVRTLTPAQVGEAARAAQAPRPKEQTEKAPEQESQKVSDDKAQEAAQLSEVLAGRDKPLAEALGGTSGAAEFNGTGGNRVSVTNVLCPCTLVSGLPVALRDGALAANVSIGPDPLRNPGLGTLSLSSPSTAVIVVAGPASRVTISAP